MYKLDYALEYALEQRSFGALFSKQRKKTPSKWNTVSFSLNWRPFKFIQDEQQTKLIEIIIYGLNNNCRFCIGRVYVAV